MEDIDNDKRNSDRRKHIIFYITGLILVGAIGVACGSKNIHDSDAKTSSLALGDGLIAQNITITDSAGHIYTKKTQIEVTTKSAKTSTTVASSTLETTKAATSTMATTGKDITSSVFATNGDTTASVGTTKQVTDVQTQDDQSAEASRLAAEEESRRLAYEEESRRLAYEEESKRLEEEAEASRIAAEKSSMAADMSRRAEESSRAAEEAARKAAEESSRKAEEEAATRYVDYTYVYVVPEAYEVLDLVNAERAKEGLGELKLNLGVCYAANKRALEVGELFSHTRPDGSACFTILSEFAIPQYWYVGENIAQGYYTSESVVAGWMNSPGHRANILKPEFTEIGISYDATTHSWVQIFYTPYSYD